MKKQTSFQNSNQKFEFGGELLKKSRHRHARPVSTRDPIHLVLKSSKAVGKNSFGHSRNVRNVKHVIDAACTKYGVKLITFSNNFNHIHLLVRFSSRALYLRFIRTMTASLVRIIIGAKKNSRATSRFFDRRPFTRIVRGFKPFKIVCDYIRLNQLEAAGVIEYQKDRLRNLSELERSFF